MVKAIALVLLLNTYTSDLYSPPPIQIAPTVERPKKIKSLPQSRVIKFLNEDIWAFKAYLKQCYEHNNAKVCATADPNFKETMAIPPISIFFRISF